MLIRGRRELFRACALALLAPLALCSLLDSVPTSLTQDLNITEKNGTVCAYGDFNSDRLTDVLQYLDGKLVILFQLAKEFATENDAGSQELAITIGTFEEVSCSVGDLNGDGNHDIVVSTRKSSGSGPWNVRYFYRKRDKEKKMEEDIGKFVEGEQNWTTADEVSLMDVTGDGIHDVVGVLENGSMLCVRGSSSPANDPRMQEPCSDLFTGWSGAVHPQMPTLMGDVTNDRFAEIIFMRVASSGELKPEVWQRVGDTEYWAKMDPQLPTNSAATFKYVLAPMLADLDLDAKMDFIVPVCKDKGCTQLESLQTIHWEESSKNWSDWTEITIEINGTRLVEEKGTLARLRVGDFTLDGYPDFVATVMDTKTKASRAMIIESFAPNDEEPRKRRFSPPSTFLVMPPMALGQAQSSHFFDFSEDGYLDVLVQWRTTAGAYGWSIIVSGAAHMGDVTFLKVQTFLPLPKGADIKDGLGVEWGGACVTYEMETTGIGAKRVGIDCQRPANSHKAGLSPPFSLFGLGRTPNFVDLVEIGVPRVTDITEGKTHIQKQIVPNARMMVQPPTDPTKPWVLRLYLTPSTLIFSSLLVMASTCSLLLLVVLILHLREKKVDRVERAAQSHRFHFDAM